jgi:RHS repeat-associated protein
LTYNYSSGLNDSISRLSSLSDSTGTLESYSFLGLDTVVIRSHPQPGIDLTYVKQGSESNGDAGDQYTGLDRFGRVVDQRWVNTSTGTATDRFQYGYDRDSNPLYRDNLVNSAFGELYTYDGLDQLASFARGTLNSARTAISGTASRMQSWDYDALGNWDSVTTNGSTQTRSANKQNEVTSISGATTPTYDANGNMTGDETGKTFVYDAWNRLVTVKSGSTTLESFSYDGLNRRVTNTIGSTTTGLYYSAGWQVLEEKVGSSTTTRYVWSEVYVDAPILRDRDTDADGTLDERLWSQQDANWNVTALLNGSGSVVERYTYDPFGSLAVYDASYTLRGGGSSYAWVHEYQGLRHDGVSGLDEANRRFYSLTLARWLGIDPIRFDGGGSNFYQFVRNGPVNRTDPTGLLPIRRTLPTGLLIPGILGLQVTVPPSPLPPPYKGGPGTGTMTVEWTITGKVNGWILQHVLTTFDIRDCESGAQIRRVFSTKGPTEFTEAWQVVDGVIYAGYQRPKFIVGGEDTFQFAGFRFGVIGYGWGYTRGWIKSEGWAKFVPNYSMTYPPTLPWSFSLQTGDLPMMAGTPPGWSDSGAVYHALYMVWNACGGPNAFGTQRYGASPRSCGNGYDRLNPWGLGGVPW